MTETLIFDGKIISQIYCNRDTLREKIDSWIIKFLNIFYILDPDGHGSTKKLNFIPQLIFS